MLLDIESHPAWVCGLKHCFHQIIRIHYWSHPAWVCGLKLKWEGGFVNDPDGHTLRGCVD